MSQKLGLETLLLSDLAGISAVGFAMVRQGDLEEAGFRIIGLVVDRMSS